MKEQQKIIGCVKKTEERGREGSNGKQGKGELDKGRGIGMRLSRGGREGGERRCKFV